MKGKIVSISEKTISQSAPRQEFCYFIRYGFGGASFLRQPNLKSKISH
jgi:hypothetical protein